MSKHLTLSERITIESMLNTGIALNRIANEVNKNRTTISREIQKHTVTVRKGTYGRAFNECIYRYEYKVTGICESKPDCVTKNCRFCAYCNSVCEKFKKETCPKLLRPPFVCNGCPDQKKCTLEKYYYQAKHAEEEYRLTLSESRSGFNLTEEEFAYIDSYVSERIKNGHSVYNIANVNKCDAPCSESTIYRLIHQGCLTAKAIDLPRTVRFKARKGKKREMKVDKKCRIGRTYADYQRFILENPDKPVTEFDSVEGKKGECVLLTVLLTSINFMLAFKRDRNTAKSVADIVNDLYGKLDTELWEQLFGLILTDNGPEFSDPLSIEFFGKTSETKRSYVFYCDANSSFQKGKVENNHEFIRKFVPKGKSFNDLSQEQIDKMMSNINSYGRPQFNGLSPTDFFISMYGEDVLHLLRQELIPAEKIILNNSIFR